MGLLSNLLPKGPKAAARQRRADALYAAAVAAARRPEFYTALGVPDTLDGRFELLALHVHLLCRRLGRAGADGRALAQDLFDTMFRDFDRTLREIGVSDPSLPHRIRKMLEAYYGRIEVYDKALDKADRSALAEALARNVFVLRPPAQAPAGDGVHGDSVPAGDGAAAPPPPAAAILPSVRAAGSAALAAYVVAAVGALDGRDDAAILATDPEFPAVPAAPFAGAGGPP